MFIILSTADVIGLRTQNLRVFLVLVEPGPSQAVLYPRTFFFFPYLYYLLILRKPVTKLCMQPFSLQFFCFD